MRLHKVRDVKGGCTAGGMVMEVEGQDRPEVDAQVWEGSVI